MIGLPTVDGIVLHMMFHKENRVHTPKDGHNAISDNELNHIYCQDIVDDLFKRLERYPFEILSVGSVEVKGYSIMKRRTQKANLCNIY